MPAWTDINQLNGVTFGADRGLTFYRSEGYGYAELDNTVNVQARYTYGPGYFENGYYYSGPRIKDYNPSFFYAAGSIQVLDDTYVAPTEANGSYVPPVFGVVRISPPGKTPTTFQVRGFSEQGVVLSKPPVSDDENPVALTVVQIAANAYVLAPGGFTDQASVPAIFGYDPTVFDTSTICFAEGTRLSTPTGSVAVEDLREGDLVLTASGVARPVTWIGHLVACPSRYPRPHQIHPVRVLAHAFGPNVPAADVRLSPGHAVHVDGVLVPVHYLINGATIVQEEVERVRYFHVELDTHDVLLAEGLPCESYLDDGNRAAFANAGEPSELRARLDPRNWENACAAMVAAGPQLIAVQERLHARAQELGWHCSEEPALRLLVNGAEVAPVHVAGQRHWFAVPATSVVTLRSRAGVLSHVMPGLTDERQLGVAVSEVRVDGVALPLDSAAFGEGFHAMEQGDGQHWRWTDGAAVLEVTAAAPVMIELNVLMTAPTWVRPATELRVVA